MTLKQPSRNCRSQEMTKMILSFTLAAVKTLSRNVRKPFYCKSTRHGICGSRYQQQPFYVSFRHHWALGTSGASQILFVP
mmetsp:Transcript_14157/g.30768  ORF Transcript_14157/g.30768 Transcript_14157/m.30768 type:complete len:80 (+) Transcript_14157:2194-2433(+)